MSTLSVREARILVECPTIERCAICPYYGDECDMLLSAAPGVAARILETAIELERITALLIDPTVCDIK